MHGLQLWVALPGGTRDETQFHHHAGSSLPTLDDGMRLAGTGWDDLAGAHALAARLCRRGADAAGHPGGARRAGDVVEGELTCTTAMLVLLAELEISVTAHGPARLVLVGGARLGPRHLVFVSSSRRRPRAEDWKARRFPAIPGDDAEFIPLPPEVGAPVDANAGTR